MRSVTEWVGRTDDTPIPARVKRRILAKSDFRCAHCGVEFSDKLKPEFHHVHSIESGGVNAESNLVAICSLCHSPESSRQATIRAKVNRIINKRFHLRNKGSMLQKREGYKYNWKRRRYERTTD